MRRSDLLRRPERLFDAAATARPRFLDHLLKGVAIPIPQFLGHLMEGPERPPPAAELWWAYQEPVRPRTPMRPMQTLLELCADVPEPSSPSASICSRSMDQALSSSTAFAGSGTGEANCPGRIVDWIGSPP